MATVFQVIVSILGVVGISSIVTSVLNNRKDFHFKIIEQKERRYRSILLYMDVYFQPNNIKYLSSRQPDIDTPEDVIQYLKAEYNEMLLYSPKEVVLSVKNFIQNPSKETYLQCVMSMRKDLWVKKTDLTIEEIKI